MSNFLVVLWVEFIYQLMRVIRIAHLWGVRFTERRVVMCSLLLDCNEVDISTLRRCDDGEVVAVK